MQPFQANLEKLEAADTQVLGVSMDSPFSNKAWAEQIKVSFPLLSAMFEETRPEPADLGRTAVNPVFETPPAPPEKSRAVLDRSCRPSRAGGGSGRA